MILCQNKIQSCLGLPLTIIFIIDLSVIYFMGQSINCLVHKMLQNSEKQVLK